MRGQVWDKALLYCRQAGAKAFGGFAYRVAVEYWEQALEAVAHLPSDRPTLEQAIDLRGELFSALLPFGQPERTLTHLRAAETLAEELGDHRRLGRICRNTASILRQLQDRESALAYCQRAYAMATRENYYGPDDSVLVERLEEKIKIVAGSRINMEISAREDLVLARAIIAVEREMGRTWQ